MANNIMDGIRDNRKAIRKRLAVYFTILALIAPFVFLFRTEIYSTILARHDDWYVNIRDNGIPVASYGYQDGVYVGEHETPRIVANAAIGYYGKMMDGNATAEIYFNNTIDWLVNHLSYFNVPTNNGTIEIAHWIFDFSIWDLPAGWYQAMSDSKGIHALALAYNFTGDDRYLELTKPIIRAFEIPISLGGNLFILDDGTSWYPEYIVPKHLDSSYNIKLILNGFLIVLRHLYDANVVLNSTRLESIFNSGVVSAAANLYKYDSPYNWTLYHLDQPIKFANNNYHRIHIELSERLYEYTNVTVFHYYAQRWKSYQGAPMFTWEEIASWEFISNGLLMAAIILAPLLAIDIAQHIIRNRILKKNK